MFREDGDRFLVVASNGGFDAPPSWYLNLRATPLAEFQTRNGVFKVVARDLTQSEHAGIWDSLTKYNPLWAAFQSCTERNTTAVALERIDASGA
jgi:deazaflavin-dependent oxidoreductase (nitroreductase family)